MEVSRKEIKYLISAIQFRQLEKQLVLNMHRDAYARGDGYVVRSLYFDSLFDQDYSDVLDGLETRKKIRLRVYSPDDQKAKLEYKFKQGANQRKSSLILSREQAEWIMSGQYEFLFQRPEPIAKVIYRDIMCGVYRPKVIIEYDRIAYSAPSNNIRVTFDSHIRASTANLDLFSHEICFTPLIEADVGVLEVKYDGFLFTYLQNALKNLDTRPMAMSKYVLGRSYIMA